MSELDEEILKQRLREEFDRLWHEANGVKSVATAVKLDPLTQNIKLEIILPGTMSKDEVELCMQRFVEHLNNQKKRKKGKYQPPPSQSKEALSEALHLATPDTTKLLALVPIIRTGIQSLLERHSEAVNMCRTMQRSGVVRYELGHLNKKLGKIKETLESLKDSVDLFAILNNKEAVFLEDESVVFIRCAERCLAIEREQHHWLQEVEEKLETLQA